MTQKVVKREPLLAVSSVNAVGILASNREDSSTRSDRETMKPLTDSSIAQYQYGLQPIWGDIYVSVLLREGVDERDGLRMIRLSSSSVHNACTHWALTCKVHTAGADGVCMQNTAVRKKCKAFTPITDINLGLRPLRFKGP